MPGSTTRYGWPFALVTEPPNGPADEGGLANGIETTVGAIDDRTAPLPKGRIGSGNRSGASSTFSAETVVDSITITAVSGRKYVFVHDAGIVGVTAGNGVNFTIRTRWASGGTLTTAGTQMRSTTTSIAVTGNFEPRQFGFSEFTAPSSGTFTLGWTLSVASGTIRSDGGAYWFVYDVGG